ncbi:MAG: hypothetical protein ACRDN9_10685 [Streptosporangiaceae bacterium]
MSPTYERESTFARDWVKLTRKQRRQFLVAVSEMVADLKGGEGFRPGLRVKGVQGRRGVFEMTWAPDGRATWQYGPEQRLGEAHIVWRRIGSHDVLRHP